MAAKTYDKEIIIGDIHVGYATKASVKPELNEGTETTNTFDGAIVDGSDTISYTVSIEKLRYDTIKNYKNLRSKLKNMRTNPETICIKENVKMPDGTMKVEHFIYKCILTDDNYTMDPTSRTAESLEFKGTSETLKIDGKEI